jgi:hypothetical protein
VVTASFVAVVFLVLLVSASLRLLRSRAPRSIHCSCLHGVTALQNVRRYPAFREVLLEPCHLRQTARLLDRSAHPPLLIIGVDTVLLIRGVRAVRCGHNEPLRLDTHDLASQLGGLIRCAEQLLCLLALHVLDLGEVQVAHGGASPDNPVSVVLHNVSVRDLAQCVVDCTYLLGRHWVAERRQMHQLLESRERIEVGKLREPVLCEDEGLEVRYTCREVRLDVRYAVLAQEQCAEARL